jgi:hypothetical protein
MPSCRNSAHHDLAFMSRFRFEGLTKDLLDYHIYSKMRDFAKLLDRSESIFQSPQRIAVLRSPVQGLIAYYHPF